MRKAPTKRQTFYKHALRLTSAELDAITDAIDKDIKSQSTFYNFWDFNSLFVDVNLHSVLENFDNWDDERFAMCFGYYSMHGCYIIMDGKKVDRYVILIADDYTGLC